MSFLIRNGFLLIRVHSVASCPFSPELFRTISHHDQLIGFCKKQKIFFPRGKKSVAALCSYNGNFMSYEFNL